jgi:glycosyltransferase involved in cell wall biosynthesis
VETLREYGYQGDVYVMENGCDIDVRYPGPETDALVNSRFGIPAGVPLFMYIGQHIWQKNLKMVIEALGALHSRGEKFHMLFVGDGPRRADMESMVADLNIADHVTFAGRIQDRELVADIYLRSSAMLFPSLYDTSSLVPREAAACGCPTVLVRGSSTAQGITDGENGFLIGNNAAALTDAIGYILHHPDKARQVGDAARFTVYRSWEDAIDVAYQRYLYLIDLKKSQTVKRVGADQI